MVFLGFIKMLISAVFAFILVWILYAVNLLTFGWLIIPFFTLLIMSGWWIGLLITALLVRFGRQIQTIAWAGVFLIAPFSAIYYPISSLPVWAQLIAKITPTSYIFEGMREVLSSGTMPIDNFMIALGLNLVFFYVSIRFFRSSFKASRVLGISRLND